MFVEPVALHCMGRFECLLLSSFPRLYHSATVKCTAVCAVFNLKVITVLIILCAPVYSDITANTSSQLHMSTCQVHILLLLFGLSKVFKVLRVEVQILASGVKW